MGPPQPPHGAPNPPYSEARPPAPAVQGYVHCSARCASSCGSWDHKHRCARCLGVAACARAPCMCLSWTSHGWARAG